MTRVSRNASSKSPSITGDMTEHLHLEIPAANELEGQPDVLLAADRSMTFPYGAPWM